MPASEQNDLESRASTPESSSMRAAKRKANEKLDSRSATPSAQTPEVKQEGKPNAKPVVPKKEPVAKEQQCEVEKILERKAHANGRQMVYLVQWRKKDDGGQAKEDSWESKSKITSISAHARKLLKDFELELEADPKKDEEVPKDEIVATAIHERKDGNKEIYLKVRKPDNTIKMMKSKDFEDREALCEYWESHLKFENEAVEELNVNAAEAP